MKVMTEAHQQNRRVKGLKRFISKRFNSSRKVVIEDLSDQLIPIIGTKKLATVIHNLFTPQECANLISMTEKRGYQEAMVHGTDGGEVLRKEIRNSGRCIIDDDELAEKWYQRVMLALEGNQSVKDHLMHAKHVSGAAGTQRQACGLNERLRYLRYIPGQYFSIHTDNSYTRGPEFGEREGETSHMTFLLYLNENFEGGETRIEGGSRWLDVVPRVGSVLVFDHDIRHRSMTMVSGTKYCCRSDFMYSATKHG